MSGFFFWYIMYILRQHICTLYLYLSKTSEFDAKSVKLWLDMVRVFYLLACVHFLLSESIISKVWVTQYSRLQKDAFIITCPALFIQGYSSADNGFLHPCATLKQNDSSENVSLTEAEGVAGCSLRTPWLPITVCRWMPACHQSVTDNVLTASLLGLLC